MVWFCVYIYFIMKVLGSGMRVNLRNVNSMMVFFLNFFLCLGVKNEKGGQGVVFYCRIGGPA